MLGMIGSSLAALGMIVQSMQEPDPVTHRMGDVFIVPSDKPDSPRDYYLRLRNEARDERWASEAETQLGRRYFDVRGIAAARLRVTCRATLCEVAGTQLGAASTDPIERVGETMQAEGSKVLMTGMNNLAIDPHDMRFLIYLKRIVNPRAK